MLLQFPFCTGKKVKVTGLEVIKYLFLKARLLTLPLYLIKKKILNIQHMPFCSYNSVLQCSFTP